VARIVERGEFNAMPLLRLALAVIGLAFAGAGVGIAIFWWTARPAATAHEPIPVSIGKASFAIPPAFVRGGAFPRPGAQERVDLAMLMPDLGPAGSGAAGAAVYVALLREDGVIDPARRVDEIYGLFLEPDVWQNPGGLLLRRFTAESPYADEELFISPPDGRRFAARCRKPAPPNERGRPADIGETCLWRFRAERVDVQARFAPEILPQWEMLAEGLRARVTGWRTP
jgi:hypothetical protein